MTEIFYLENMGHVYFISRKTEITGVYFLREIFECAISFEKTPNVQLITVLVSLIFRGEAMPIKFEGSGIAGKRLLL